MCEPPAGAMETRDPNPVTVRLCGWLSLMEHQIPRRFDDGREAFSSACRVVDFAYELENPE